jgi:peptidoglycan/xylan/chitin deacetylase (PgdA/CDA1 family)
MRALSLEYHDVVAADDFDSSGFHGAGPASYKLTPAVFAAHLRAIQQAATTAPAGATDWLAGPAGCRPLFLTFDDGGLGAYTHIADALERHGWPGHFFVTTDRIGSRTFLTPSHIRDLDKRGHVIGTHSCSHPARLGAWPPDQILGEWQRSVNALEDIIGKAVLTGSVPGGFYTPAVGAAAAEAGLRVLFTSWPTTRCWTVGDCRIVGRYTIRRWSSARTAAALAAGRAVPRLSQWGWYRSLHLLRTVAGDRYTALRQTFWAKRDPAVRSNISP